MIDTDRYTGYPPAPWGWRHKVAVWRLTANGDKEWIDVQVDEDTDPTVMALIADAPLLLAEVKKLQKRNEWLEEVVALAQEHGAIDLSDCGWPQWEGEQE